MRLTRAMRYAERLRGFEILIAAFVIVILGSRSTEAQTPVPIERAETKLSATKSAPLKEAADRWGLTEAEYRRYQELMKGPRGALSDPTITPIEVLGIEARSMAEREKYAELYVDMMARETDKALAFTRTVHATWARTHGDVKVLNHARINAAREDFGSRYGPLPLGLRRPGRLMIFTRLGCGPCQDSVSDALAKVDAGKFSGADIYFVELEQGRDADIRKWARTLDLPVEIIRKRRITLNYDQGEYEFVSRRLKRSFAGETVFIERRGDAYESVSENAL